MWYLYVISWVALVLQVVLFTFAVAAGLYYLAEIVEEYCSIAKRVITTMNYCIMAVNMGYFLFESNLHWTLLILSFVANLLYLFLLKDFPFLNPISPAALLSMLVFGAQHYFAFSNFSQAYFPPAEILAYFCISIWIMPFAFLVSLSANENILPTTSEAFSSGQQHPQQHDDVVTNYFHTKSKRYGLLSLFKYAESTLLPQRMKKGY